jgi:hypothetical protein
VLQGVAEVADESRSKVCGGTVGILRKLGSKGFERTLRRDRRSAYAEFAVVERNRSNRIGRHHVVSAGGGSTIAAVEQHGLWQFAQTLEQ